MLDQSDFTQIGELISERLKENNTVLRKEITGEITERLTETSDVLRKEMRDNNDVLRKEMRDNNDVLRKEIKENNVVLVKEIAIQFAEVLELQVLPQITGLHTKFDALDAKVATLPDKSYLDDKLADVKGELIVIMRKEDKKLDFSIDLLEERGALIAEDVHRIKQDFQVFPRQSM